MIKKDNKSNVMFVSNDLGYGEIKADFDGVAVKQPSVYKEIFSGQDWEDINLDNDSEVSSAIANLLNNLDVSIDDGRYLVGNAAMNSLDDTTTMQMDSPIGKAKGNAALILPLAYIAGRAIQEKYQDTDEEFDMDDVIPVKVFLTTALPITEAGSKDNDQRPDYINRFTQKPFIVTVHSLGEDIVVSVKFEKVVVLKEGLIATSTAIQHGDSKLIKYLVSEIKKDYPDRADDAENLILNTQNYISVDIGQGTTDMALFYNGHVNGNSYSIKEGFGNIINEAFNSFPDASIKNVENFVKLWQADENELQPNQIKTKNEIDRAIADRSLALQKRIITGITEFVNKYATTDVIFLFGGGSIPMVERYGLKERIQKRIADLNTSAAVVVWAGKEYSQNLNEIALKTVSDYMRDHRKQSK